MIAKSSKCSRLFLQGVGQWGKVEDFEVCLESGRWLRDFGVCDYPRNCQA